MAHADARRPTGRPFAGPQQLIADLATGGPTADHEHGPLRQIVRTPVPGRVGLQHRTRDPVRHRRNPWPLERAGGNDDLTGVDRPAGHGEHESTVIPMELDDLCVLPNQCPRGFRVLLDDAQDLGPVGEAVGLVARVRVSRQLERPVRELEAQRVPPLRPPASSHLSPFEHDVLQTAPLQNGAHCQSGLAASDDDDVVMLAHARPEISVPTCVNGRRFDSYQLHPNVTP